MAAGAPPSPLELLPHDVLRRVVDAVETGGANCAARTPLRTALVLAQVSRRLRAYVVSSYLPSIATITLREFEPLKDAADPPAAAAALEALLARCTGLRHFSSDGASPGLVTSTAVRAMANAAFATLEDVDIKYIDVNDDAIRPLFFCPRLKRLELSYGRDATEELFDLGLGKVIQAPLEYLDLTWVVCVDRRAIALVAEIPTLKFLFLKNCEQVDNDAIALLLAGKAAKSLETLSVSYCPFSDGMLKSIIPAMPSLRRLLVAERSGVHFLEGSYTLNGIDDARNDFPNVKIEFDT